MDAKKFQEFVRNIAKRFRPSQRRRVHSMGRTVWRTIATFTLLSGLVSFVVNGTELFTKKIPAAVASISKYLLLAQTGRPLLLKRLVEQDLALTGSCTGKVLVSDFDGDGQATDLVIELLSRDDEGNCAQDLPTGTAYALMKDSPSKDLWPKYTLLRLIARSDIGIFQQGTGYPLTFEQKGKFLIGRIHGTDFPGWVVYGYANGQMHEFGRYRPLGSLSEIEGSEPISQIGDKLFLPTEAGILSLAITPDGRFEETTLSPRDIVQRNNTALVLEVFSAKPDEIDDKNAKAHATGSVRAAISAAFETCGYWAMANGLPLELKAKSPTDSKCVAVLQVSPITTILPMVICEFKGFKQTQQFPWGKVLDSATKDPSITCPIDGESASSPGFTLKISVEP